MVVAMKTMVGIVSAAAVIIPEITSAIAVMVVMHMVLERGVLVTVAICQATTETTVVAAAEVAENGLG